MDGSENNHCGTPSRIPKQVRWLFDEIDSGEEGDGENFEVDTVMEHQQLALSSRLSLIDGVERMDVSSENSETESFNDVNESDAVLPGFVLGSNHAVDSESEPGHARIEVEDRECSLETTGSVSVVQNEPASIVTSLEKKQYLQNIVDNVSSLFPDLALVLGFDGLDRSNPLLTISQRNLFSHPPYGMASRVHIVLQYKSYKVYVLMRLWKEGELTDTDDVIELCNILGHKSKHKFCPGIDPDLYEREYHQKIRFHIRSVRLSSFPFSRVDSVNCKFYLYQQRMHLLQRRKQ